MKQKYWLPVIFLTIFSFYIAYYLVIKDMVEEYNVNKTVNDGDIYILNNDDLSNKSTFVEFKKENKNSLKATIKELDVEKNYNTFELNEIEQDSKVLFESGYVLIPNLIEDARIEFNNKGESISVNRISDDKELLSFKKSKKEEVEKIKKETKEIIEELNVENEVDESKVEDLKTQEDNIESVDRKISDDLHHLEETTDTMNELIEELEKKKEEDNEFLTKAKKSNVNNCDTEETEGCFLLEKIEFVKKDYKKAEEINESIFEDVEKAQIMLKEFINNQQDSDLHSNISYDESYFESLTEETEKITREYNKINKKWSVYQEIFD